LKEISKKESFEEEKKESGIESLDSSFTREQEKGEEIRKTDTEERVLSKKPEKIKQKPSNLAVKAVVVLLVLLLLGILGMELFGQM